MTDRIKQAKKQAIEEIEARYKSRIQELCPTGLNEARIRKSKAEKQRRKEKAGSMKEAAPLKKKPSHPSSLTPPIPAVAEALVVYSMVSPSAPSPPRKPYSSAAPRAPLVSLPDEMNPLRSDPYMWHWLLACNCLIVSSIFLLLYVMYLEFGA